MCADLQEAAQATATPNSRQSRNAGIGVAGTGISGCGPAIGLGVDITSRDSIRAMLRQAILAYGGIDSIVVTAGVYVPPDTAGNLPDDKWKFTFDVNVMGLYLVADEAKAIFASQGLPAASS